MKYAVALLLVPALALSSVACASTAEGDLDSTSEDIRVASSFTARASAYFPDDSEMEGGYNDMRGKRLQTLQGFLKGQAKYVSVAMDKGIFKYGQRLRVREVNERYGREVIFRVVDTGGAFYGKGKSRIDICVANEQLSFEKLVNSKLTIEVIDESSPDPETTGSSSSSGGSSSTSGPSTGASYCRSHGDCNPGNNGSGKICVDKACVPGCKSDAHCPAVQKCVSGMCR
jgi:3D (Asp-Asp-Asp) domain-containing protein